MQWAHAVLTLAARTTHNAQAQTQASTHTKTHHTTHTLYTPSFMLSDMYEYDGIKHGTYGDAVVNILGE